MDRIVEANWNTKPSKHTLLYRRLVRFFDESVFIVSLGGLAAVANVVVGLVMSTLQSSESLTKVEMTFILLLF
jgi:hypothetical protein